MADLSAFLAKHPHLGPGALQEIKTRRHEVELHVQEIGQRIAHLKRSWKDLKRSPKDFGQEASPEIQRVVAVHCWRLFALLSANYLNLLAQNLNHPLFDGDFAAYFEEMVDATLGEGDRLYRNATGRDAEMWFEGTPDLAHVRLSKKSDDSTTLFDRLEELRHSATREAMRMRVEREQSMPMAQDLPKPVAHGARESRQRVDRGGADEDNRAQRRGASVRPILDEKGWSILDWASNSHVDFHTAHDYLKGITKPFSSTRKKLADSLGVAVIDLPA